MAHPFSWKTLTAALALAILAGATPHTASLAGTAPHTASLAPGSLPLVTITGVASDNSNAKIDFLPVPGAKDYRIFDVTNPMMVKYGGMLHLDAGPQFHFVMQPNGVAPVFPYTSTWNGRGGSGPQTLDVPSTEIQWNMLDDGQPHTLVVQAVNQIGPVPSSNLYDANDNPLFPPGAFLGSNEGPTADGNTSINGQGSYTSTPQVIAQSAPFVAQANKALQALPSSPDAVQTFFDTFDNSEAATIHQVGSLDARTGAMTYTLNGGTSKAWDIIYQGADTDHSAPFIMDGHFMDVLFDGPTPSAIPAGYCQKYGVCPHTQYTNMALSPHTTADLSGGKLLHLTMEVDSEFDQTHRWLAWQLAPATDPITNFKDDNYVTSGNQPSANTLPPNHSDQALWLQLFPSDCDAMLFDGPTSPSNPAPRANQFIPFNGASGHSPLCYHTEHWGGNGVGLDNRIRWDLFLTTHHLAVFVDGQLMIQSDIPSGGLPFNQAKVYFTHYVYSTSAEPQRLASQQPWDSFWINNMTHSDERHWDNMGFEVLPANDVPADWSTLASRIHLPPSIPPA